FDEHDRRRIGITSNGDGILTFPAELRPDEVRDRAGVRVPEGDVYDTVGGYVMSVLESIPVVRDTVALEDGVLTVARMSGRRVVTLTYEAKPGEAGEGDE